MRVCTPLMYNYICSSKYQKNNVNFQSKCRFNSVNSSQGIEYSMRVVVNKLNDLFSSKASKRITRNMSELVPEPSNFFLAQLSEIGRLYSTQKIIDVNIEDKILDKIAESGKSTIFIMNHSNQTEDPQMLAVLNTLLAEAYKKTCVDKFPLPKIILNEDILKSMNPIRRKAFENFGAVGVDASIIGGDKDSNVSVLLPLIKAFIKNQCNIFIFPEGRLAINKKLDLQGRFQPGVASLINKIVGIKKEVVVVPVGFAYGKNVHKDLTAMNIGTPLEIKRDGIITTITHGDVDKNKNSILYTFFSKNKDVIDVPITKEGQPVEPQNIVGFLKTIICDNLEINTNIANQKLLEPLKGSNVEIY